MMEPLPERNPEHAATRKVIGLNQYMLNRADLAEAELKRAVSLAPQDAEAHYYLGRVLFMRDNPAGALAAFQKATELDASSVRAYNHLGQAYEALVQYPAAREAYLKAIELEKRQSAKSEWPFFNLGALCLREGRAAEAEGYFRQALERQPGWSEGKAKLGMALLALDKLPEALSYSNKPSRLIRRTPTPVINMRASSSKWESQTRPSGTSRFSGNRRNHEAKIDHGISLACLVAHAALPRFSLQLS